MANDSDFDLQVTQVAPHIVIPLCDVAAWEADMENDPDFQQRMDALMDELNHDGLVDAPALVDLVRYEGPALPGESFRTSLFLDSGTLH